MKTIRVVLALFILLSLNSLSAFAQANAETTFAYLSLVPAIKSDPLIQNTPIPIELQSRQVYQTLFPKLLEAQKQGQIVEFRPEFSFGMVKVEYAANTDLAVLLGDSVWIFNDPETLLAETQVRGKKMGSSSDVPLITIPVISIEPKSSCFSGYNFAADRYFNAYLMNSTGKLMSVADGYTDSNSSLRGCFGWGDWSSMEPGYRFTLKLYQLDRTTLLKTYSKVIPRMAITSINVTSKTVAGTAPANSSITVEFAHRNLNSTGGYSYTTNSLITPGTGKWQTTFTIAMRGADWTHLIYSPTANFMFYAYLDAPNIYCGLGSNYCYIYGPPYMPASLTIRHAGVDQTFSGKFGNWGGFYGELTNSEGSPVFLQVGDQAWGTGLPTLTIPLLTAIPDYSTDIVSGNAPVSKFLYTYLYVRNDCGGSSCWYAYDKYIKSSISGMYGADYSSSLDIKPTDTFSFEVDYFNPVTGNVVSYRNLISP